jgi:hypothetical protein
MYAKGDYLKVDETPGESEWMWVSVERDDPASRIVFGTLGSEPIAIDRPDARPRASRKLREHQGPSHAGIIQTLLTLLC